MTYPCKFTSTDPSVFSVGAVHERVALLLLLAGGATGGCCVPDVIALDAPLAEVVDAEPLPPHPTRVAAMAKTPRSGPGCRFARYFISILRTRQALRLRASRMDCLKWAPVRCAQGATGPIFGAEESQMDCSEATGIHARRFFTRSQSDPS